MYPSLGKGVRLNNTFGKSWSPLGTGLLWCDWLGHLDRESRCKPSSHVGQILMLFLLNGLSSLVQLNGTTLLLINSLLVFYWWFLDSVSVLRLRYITYNFPLQSEKVIVLLKVCCLKPCLTIVTVHFHKHNLTTRGHQASWSPVGIWKGNHLRKMMYKMCVFPSGYLNISIDIYLVLIFLVSSEKFLKSCSAQSDSFHNRLCAGTFML